MAARITGLVLRREMALSLLKRASADRYVQAAIAVLEDEPAAGELGGPARDQAGSLQVPNNARRRRANRSPAPSLRTDLGVSARERQILEQVSMGLTNDQVAHRLFISEDTVKTHLRRMFRRFGVSNRTALVTAAMDRAA